MRTVLVVALVVAAMTGTCTWAAPLAPGTSVDNPLNPGVVPDFTLGLPGYFTPPNLIATLVSPYSGAFTGTVTSRVYRDPGDLTLAFEYYYTNTTPGPVLDIIRSTIGDTSYPWLGYLITDAGSDESGTSTVGGGGGVNWTDGDPTFLLRDPAVSGAGLTIQWRALSDGTVLRNTTLDDSALVWFDTNAFAYQTTNVGILDSGGTSNAEGYAPRSVSTLIPEPTTLSLLGLALLAMARRRRKS